MLEHLARFGILTVKDLAQIILGKTDKVTLSSLVRTTRILERQAYVNRIHYRPEDYERGLLPLACGLSGKGVAWANENCPATHPKVFFRERSPFTIEHDLKAARTHIAVFNLCQANGWELGCLKDNAYALVRPDRFFEITANGKCYRFFLEEENHRKDFKSLYTKLQPYVRYRGTADFCRAWGFRYYSVIVPMRDEDAAENLRLHLDGRCTCADPNMRRKHTGAPFKLDTQHIQITSHDELVSDPARFLVIPREACAHTSATGISGVSGLNSVVTLCR